VELSPAVFPALVDVLDARRRRRLSVGVRRELDAAVELALLEAARETLEPRRSGLLGALSRNLDRDTL